MNKPRVIDDGSPYICLEIPDVKHGELFVLNLDNFVVKHEVKHGVAYYWLLCNIEDTEIDKLTKEIPRMWEIYQKTMPDWYRIGRDSLSEYKRNWGYKYWQVDFKYRAPVNWFKNKDYQVYPNPMFMKEWANKIKTKYKGGFKIS